MNSQWRSRWGATRWPSAIFVVPAIFVGIMMLIPILYLALRAFGAEQSILDLIWRQRTLDILLRSLLLMISTTAASIIIAVPIAWLTVRTDLPFRRVWSVLTVLPLVIPSYIFGTLVVAGLGPKGMLQHFLEGIIGLERLPEIYGFPGALITLTLISFPYVLLTTRAALWRIDPKLEEASRSLGQKPWNSFTRVTLPLLKPAIAAGGLLVALYTLSDFGAVSLMRYETFTWAVYLQYQSAFNRHVAAALALVLIAVAAVVVISETRARSKAKYYRTHTGSAVSTSKIQLGGWRWPALFFCGSIVTFSLVLPISILGYWLVRGIAAGEEVWLQLIPAINSVYASGLAAIAMVLIAIPMSILVVRYKSWFTGSLERISYLGFAMPGVAVALALVFFGINLARPIYQTIVILVLAYFILFFPTALGAIRTSLLQISPTMEEAARSMGKSSVAIFFKVHIPLLKTGILAGGALVFLLAMKELPATMILGPIGFTTLATSIWAASSEAFFAQTAAPSLLLILISSFSIAFLMKRERWT